MEGELGLHASQSFRINTNNGNNARCHRFTRGPNVYLFPRLVRRPVLRPLVLDIETSPRSGRLAFYPVKCFIYAGWIRVHDLPTARVVWARRHRPLLLRAGVHVLCKEVKSRSESLNGDIMKNESTYLIGDVFHAGLKTRQQAVYALWDGGADVLGMSPS